MIAFRIFFGTVKYKHFKVSVLFVSDTGTYMGLAICIRHTETVLNFKI